MNKFLNVAMFTSAIIFFSGSAQAFVAPYYAYGDIFTRQGTPSFSVIEAKDQASTGPVSVAGGSQWWCDAGTPNCGVSVSSGASSAYAEVSVDPVTGTLGARAGSLGYDVYGGYGRGYGYISQVFTVGTDGSLQSGDNVSVDLSMLLDGSIDSQTWSGTVAGLVALNYYDPAQKYDDYLGNQLDYMPASTFEDLLYSPNYLNSLLGNVRFVENQPGALINYSGSDMANVKVGDQLIMEAMLYTTNDRGPSLDGLGISWSDALNTMTPSLTATTAGATLNVYQPSVVPVPAAVWLFGSGLVGLLGFARRKN